MIGHIIRLSMENRLLVALLTAALVALSIWTLFHLRLDAIPDLSDVQVIVTAEYPGQNPRVVDDQVTYPLASAMLSVPGSTAEKDGYTYRECGTCESLFVSPRPRRELLSAYYTTSAASRFRAAQFAGATAAQRRFHLLRANAGWMARLTEENLAIPSTAYADYASYAPQLFDEIADVGAFGEMYSIHPRVPVAAACGVPVRELSLAECPPVAAISAFEKLEHQHAPGDLLKALRERLLPGGLLFLTTRTSSGFDLQVLWDKTPYIFVPEHLNLLSIRGLELLVQRSGFEVIELSTPGQLDVELVQQALAADPSIVLPRFFARLFAGADQTAHQDFQAFLQKHRLSSHVRLALRNRG